jgi:coenzyme F420 hydrogenase subunit beta
MSEHIDSIVNNELCTGCGTCVGICSEDALEIRIDHRKGIYTPQVDEGKCSECGLCLKVCPGQAVDFEQLNLAIFGQKSEDILLGNYINCYIGHATDHEIRYNSASGGLVTALLLFALEEGMIDGALVTKMSEDSPLEPKPFIATTREEIISAARSKYCPVPANIALKEILKKEGKFAIVGLPCHIHGIRKAELVNKKLKGKVVLHLGLFCGAPMTFKGTDFVLQKYGLTKENIAHLDYRGEGWPGYMTVQFKGGAKKLIPRSEYGIFHSLGFFTPSRCALCCDQINVLADISLGDAFLPELEADRIGTSAIICRSKVGENLLTQATGKGRIALFNIEIEKVRLMESKKVSFPIHSRLAYLSCKKRPSYNTSLPKAGSIPIFLLLYAYTVIPVRYLNMLFSSIRGLGWLVRPMAILGQIFMKSGSKLARLTRLK